MIQQITTLDQTLLTGEYGLERETLRVTGDGHMAHTPHPFPNDEHIVKDFCENQTEINTGVHCSAEGVIAELTEHTARLKNALYERGERLWMYSNPPYLLGEEDIPVAVFEGEEKHRYRYRIYLSEKYGRYIMTLSGIHVNYSLSEELLRLNFTQSDKTGFAQYKNEVYLRLAERLTEYGWVINLLLSASPVVDGSYFSIEDQGKTLVTRYSSLRGGREGYWNRFSPRLDYSDIQSYTESIRRYIDSGMLSQESELYYPIRLKPRGANRLDVLAEKGVNHIEIRNVDLNPFAEQGIDSCDLDFIELLILYLISAEPDVLSILDQDSAVENFKNAALLNIDEAQILLSDGVSLSVRQAGLRLLQKMKGFFERMTTPYDIKAILAYQQSKLTERGVRYAERVVAEYGDSYVEKMINNQSLMT